MHTIIPIAAGNPFSTLFATLAGVLASLLAGLLGLVVGIAAVILVGKLIQALTKNPSWEKLAGLVAVMCFGVMLAGASPGLLKASYQYGKDLVASGGGSAEVNFDSSKP